MLIELLAFAIIAAQAAWIYLAHRRSRNREELFRIITENAADMMALADHKGHRLYNSPAYEKILGYSPEELARTPVFEQLHPDDRFKVIEAGREARSTGVGQSCNIVFVTKMESGASSNRPPARSRTSAEKSRSWSLSIATSPSASPPKRSSLTTPCTTH